MPENSTYRSLESLLAKKGGQLVVDVINNYDERRVRCVYFLCKKGSSTTPSPSQELASLLRVSHFVFICHQRDAKMQDPSKVTKANKISREACKAQWSTWDASRTERLYRANGFRVMPMLLDGS